MSDEVKALHALTDAVEAFLAAYRARYRNGRGTIRPNAPMHAEAVALNDAYMAVPPLNARSEPSTPPEGWREAVARLIISHDDHTDWSVALEIADAIASISVQDRRGSVGEEDLGSVVCSGCAALLTSPSAAGLIATPSEGAE